jgi:NAD(P)-dependent dehydrogenase (short-subunit alcohol dehydrogenase family)
MSELLGRVAVVTGASLGIGAVIAKGLGAAGAKVVENYASSKDGAGQVVAAIARKGGQESPSRATCRRSPTCGGCSRRPGSPSGPWTCS